MSRLDRGRALWRIGERSLLARHFRPDRLVDITDTDTLMRRDGERSGSADAASTS